jgi:CrcB protein
LIYGWFEKQQLNSSDWKLILTAGFCGGFTTFSAFSMENIQMMRDGQTLMAILYIFSSLLFGLLLTWLGMSLTRT